MGLRPILRTSAIASLVLATCGCASLDLERDTQTSGTFRSSALSFTVLSYDLPERALDVAIANASDAERPNSVITSQAVFPNLGPLDWLLDILSVRYAVVEGTWGFAEEGSFTDVDGD